MHTAEWTINTEAHIPKFNQQPERLEIDISSAEAMISDTIDLIRRGFEFMAQPSEPYGMDPN